MFGIQAPTLHNEELVTPDSEEILLHGGSTGLPL